MTHVLVLATGVLLTLALVIYGGVYVGLCRFLKDTGP